MPDDRAVVSTYGFQNRDPYAAAAYDAKQTSVYQYSREWVAASPTPAHWRDTINIYRNLSGIERAQQAPGAVSWGPSTRRGHERVAGGTSEVGEADGSRSGT